MLSVYPACFFKEAEGYSVVFPDLDFLATCGDTLAEALAMAEDCLAGRLYEHTLEKSPYPAPSALEDVDLAAVARELDVRADAAFVNLVAVDVIAYAKAHFNKSVKKTLSIPAWLNDAAEQRSINFSQVLQEALRHRLGYDA